jgi:aryl-alcohol dehydrogenase-like predicted oxidoreductase
MAVLRALTVSPQGLGCMSFSHSYGQADEDESIRTIHRAIDLGVTFFDTASGYGSGHNETLLGRAIAGKRDGLVIASKFANRLDGGGLDGSPAHARLSVEGSLKRLNLDHIDLYYVHRIDPKTPIEDTVGELGRLQQEGKIGGVGLSEAAAEIIRRADKTHPIEALQSEYSLWTRDIEPEILPTVRELGIGFVAYSPLGRGFLAGSQVTDPNDRRHQHPRFQPEAVAANSVRREAIERVAERLGASVAQVSLAWVLSKGVVPIPGTRHIKHLESNWAANALKLDAATTAELEAAYPRGSTVGERYPAQQLAHIPPSPVAA